MTSPAVPYDKDLLWSKSPPTAPPSPISSDDDDNYVDDSDLNGRIFEQLLQQGFSTGLAEALVASKEAFAMRFWIV